MMVIGSMGFVGSTMVRAFETYTFLVETIQIDRRDPATEANYQYAVDAEVVFICVGTPYDPVKERYDYGPIIDVLKLLRERRGHKTVVCLRSTVTPDFFRTGLANQVDVCHPEFLRAKHADEDFAKPDVHVFGAWDDKKIKVIHDLYQTCRIIPKKTITFSRPDVAAAAKMVHNVYLAQRISFLNEMHVAAERGWDGWNGFSSGLNALFEARGFGGRYMTVPGPDGQLGFGGACLSKDLAAFIAYLKRNGLPHEMLRAARVVNSKMRMPV